MASGSIQAPAQQMQVNPTLPGFSIGGGGGGGFNDNSSITSIAEPEALAILMNFLQTGGITPQMQAQQKERNTTIKGTRASLQDYSKGAAFQDASQLVAQYLRDTMEKNMPAINKAVQNAGVSGSALQALLSQKLATTSAQDAGALGAKMSVDYGQISQGLQGVLEALTRVDSQQGANIVGALNALKSSRQVSTQQQYPQNPTFSMTASGGGSSPVQNSSVASQSPYQDGVWYGPGGVPRTQEYVNATAGLPAATYGGPNTSRYDPAVAVEEDLGWGYGD